MAAYLPFGKKSNPSKERIRSQQDKFKKYDYYGIPYGCFDGNDEGNFSQYEQDCEEARLLILQGKELPEELAKRLLEYKKNGETVCT